MSTDQQQEDPRQTDFEDNLVTTTVSNLGVLLLERRRRKGMPIYIPSLKITINGNNYLLTPSTGAEPTALGG